MVTRSRAICRAILRPGAKRLAVAAMFGFQHAVDRNPNYVKDHKVVRKKNKRTRQTAARENGRLGGRPRKADALVARVQALYDEVFNKLSGVDPGDALLIIERMCRGPRDNRAFFIFSRPGGGYDF